MSDFRKSISDLPLSKLVKIVPGGRERQDSVRNGLEAVEEGIDLIAVHDGVRPFVSEKTICEAIKAAAEHGAASVGVPVKDTIKTAGTGGSAERIVEKTLDRKSLWITQTPQVFRTEIIREAYRRAYDDGYYGTDDAALVERIGLPVVMVPGTYENIKITTPEDLAYGEFILGRNRIEQKADMKVGIGYDSHRLAEGRKLILGGVEIPHGRGLDGHSDADALVHAVIDALLGAMGEGDIGKHFPDSDPAYKGIYSLELLARVGSALSEKKFAIGNIDVTVLIEEPRLGPFIDAMKKNISRVLGIRAESVNIKAKTDEGMGFVGRREGAAVFAIAHLVSR